MNQGPVGARRQAGIALILLLVVLILGASYAFYRSANIGTGRAQQDGRLAATLARAKEALIARAVTDANRPGSLPCPDLVTNSVGLANVPGDGKADMFTLTQCPSYVGWLPWVTLDLPELTDDSGTRLWYAMSPTLRDDDSAQPINSDTGMPLQLDGAADIAALVVAPRAALGSQVRPTNNMADYLDGANGNGDDRIYVSGPAGAAFNDMAVAITRRELMAAVEKRVANELRSCLEQHAMSAANTAHTYPWPAPLSSSNLRGTAGSLFGQVPATQPGAGPENLLQKATADLSAAKTGLSGASTAAAQLAALQTVGDVAAYGAALFDRIYSMAAGVAQVASTTRTLVATLGTDITGAVANNRISRTERTALRAEAIDVLDDITALKNALADSGIDPYPGEVQAQILVLQQRLTTATASPTAATFSALQAQAALLSSLFARSTTANPDIAATLNNALTTAGNAQTTAASAAALPGDATRGAVALAGAQALVTAGGNLRNTIIASRVNLHASDISAPAGRVSSLLTQFAAAPGSATAAVLATGLGDLQLVVNSLATSSSPVVSARATTLAALTNALAVAGAATDYAGIQTTSAAVVTAAGNLATAVAGNGDNVVRESLTAAANAFLGAQTVFNTVVTPTQATMVPYVLALRTPAADIAYWADLVARDATDIATQARKAPGATSDSTGSAYYAASELLTGIGGSGGAQAALQAYIDAPTSAAKQAGATSALVTTLGQVDAVLAAATALDAVLDSGSAEAMPTVWYGSACAFLQPPSGSTSWWTANGWANLVFYQISDRVRGASGRLTVNGAGAHHVVALAAGRALGAQNRTVRTTANFLEGGNADTSRDGSAANPAPTFTNATPSDTFNDRLAY